MSLSMHTSYNDIMYEIKDILNFSLFIMDYHVSPLHWQMSSLKIETLKSSEIMVLMENWKSYSFLKTI